jgi:hypothetical protein
MNSDWVDIAKMDKIRYSVSHLEKGLAPAVNRKVRRSRLYLFFAAHMLWKSAKSRSPKKLASFHLTAVFQVLKWSPPKLTWHPWLSFFWVEPHAWKCHKNGRMSVGLTPCGITRTYFAARVPIVFFSNASRKDLFCRFVQFARFASTRLDWMYIPPTPQ